MENISVRTTVKPELIRYTLWKGVSYAVVGSAILIYAISLPIEKLKIWGLPLFLFAGVLFTLGMLPYRKLTRLEKTPDKLLLNANETLTYVKKGKPILTIPLAKIERTAYLERGRMYGIGIEITPHSQEKTLFFPYFSQRSYKTLFNS